MGYVSELCLGSQLLMHSTISACDMFLKLPVAIAAFRHAALYTSSLDLFVDSLVDAIFELFLKIPIFFLLWVIALNRPLKANIIIIAPFYVNVNSFKRKLTLDLIYAKIGVKNFLLEM